MPDPSRRCVDASEDASEDASVVYVDATVGNLNPAYRHPREYPKVCVRILKMSDPSRRCLSNLFSCVDASEDASEDACV